MGGQTTIYHLLKCCDIFKAAGNFNGSSCILNRSSENLAYFSVIDTLCEYVAVFLQTNSHLKTMRPFTCMQVTCTLNAQNGQEKLLRSISVPAVFSKEGS